MDTSNHTYYETRPKKKVLQQINKVLMDTMWAPNQKNDNYK